MGLAIYTLLTIFITYYIISRIVRENEGNKYSYRNVYRILIASILLGWLLAPILIVIFIIVIFTNSHMKPPNWL